MRDKTYAVTGATGLIGSHLIKYLVSNDAKVFAMSSDMSTHIDGVTTVYGDIKNIADVDSFVKQSQPDIFIHLAGYTDTGTSKINPKDTLDVNVLGTSNVLESLRVYGNAEAVVIPSSDRSQEDPLSIYGASKLAIEEIASSYKATFGMPIVTLRICNVFGPGDTSGNRFIPLIIKSYYNDEVVTLTSGGLDRRGYVHVDDVINAIILAVDYVAVDGAIDLFDIRSYRNLTNLEVFDMVSERLPMPIQLVIDGEKSASHDREYSQLASYVLGWSPQISLNDSIDDLVKWYQNFYESA